MPSEPDWLTAADVITLHAEIVAATGEPDTLRDMGLLESAVARPRQHFAYADEADIVELACLLMLAVARNHPFVQGNKRAAFVAGQAFLEFNGYRLAMPDDVAFADALISTLADAALDPSFVSRVRQSVVPLP